MTVSRRVVVVGGGIVGLAAAHELTLRGHQVTVLEKTEQWASHQTGHNSGVIHAGPYYKPGSLKATMCLAGNRSMTRFAQEHGIAHDICGKLIVATSADQIPRLQRLMSFAEANGTPARMVSASEAREYEPHVRAVQAMRVESTGIIDYTAVSVKLAELAELGGAELVLGAEVTAISQRAEGITVEHTKGRVEADLLVNCAGLHSDRVAALAGLDPEVRIIPFRGEYYELTAERSSLVNGLIYPVPDPDLPFLGVHLTRMIDGTVHAGPNAVLALAREGYSWRDRSWRDTRESVLYPGFARLAAHNLRTGTQEVLRSFSRRRFAASLAELVPEITKDDIVRSGSGVRAQAVRRDGSLADDFIIQKAPHQVHVLNAPSPAATSALEIAKHIAQAAESVS
ncbi:L-2-hydroxyglutarate oxidase [Aeromicrobium wangtongii]|uniref:L-2-hydroxyglutarate oxidase n=1 Tax=Aeromicrobium wangtongii TaxID=2969247 RepID=A0ABY5MB12_9ACTN|nr:L-2-hydroxyglutarate oxidase [Aeromicrobium wangtongii]MCD9199579.1 L-2-hydroxyglutarate oxidase [Aeromicrobium wangtongii]UUP13932.1 L-2-hydroxyglutarate oxidase [Aeromicrobium wangtongii]